MAELSQIPTSLSLGSLGSGAPAPAPVPARAPLADGFIPFAPGVPYTPPVIQGPVGAPPSITETKKAEVEQASATKKALFGSAEDIRKLGTGIQNGNDLGSDQMAQDLASGEAGVIATRYGSDVLHQAPALWDSMRRDDFNAAGSRSNGEIAGDSALGVVSGAVGTLGGLAALGTGLVDPHAGAVVSKAVTGTTDAIHGAQSDKLITQREAAARRGELNQEDINTQYAKDVANGKDYAGLRRFGREVLSGGKDLLDHPGLAGDMVAEGVGSLASGGITKGLSIGEKMMPLVIGLLEAGGSYTDVQSQVQAMDDASLMKGSAEYRDLRSSGMSEGDAKDRIANIAGMQAAALAGIGGAASGKLVSKFEHNIFGHAEGKGFVGSLRELGKTSLSEFTEEGTQGVTGPLAGNIGIQQNANDQLDVTAGLGQQAIQGAIAGLGSAGPVQLPHLGAAALSDTGKGLATIGKGMAAAGQARVQAVADANDAKSPFGKNAVQRAVETISTGVGAIKTGLEERKAAQAAAKAVEDPANVPDTSAAAEAQQKQDDLEQRVADVESLPPEKIRNLMLAIEGGALTPDHAAAASLMMRDHAKKVEALLNEDLSSLPASAKAGIEGSRKALNTFLSSPTVADAITKAESTTHADLGELGSTEVTAENVKTPKVKAAVENTVRLADANPAGIDPKFVNQALAQSDALGLTPATQAKLKAAAFLAEQAAKTQEAQVKLESDTNAELKKSGSSAKAETPTSIVTKGIQEDGANARYNQFSLSKHQADITHAVDVGNTVEANRLLKNLRNFAEHMQNKVKAARESAAMKRLSGNEVRFDGWTGQTWLRVGHKSAGKIYIPDNPNGQQLLKSIEMDEQAVTGQYNKLVDIYGGWNGIVASKMAPVTSTNIAQKDQENAVTDPKPTEAQGTQGGTDSQGSTSSSEDQAGTPPPEGEAGAGDAGAGSAGSDAGAGTDASGTGSEPAAGTDPEPLTGAEKTVLKKAVAELRKTLREMRRDWRATRRERRELYNYDSSAKRPLTALLIKAMKIDPKGSLGRELIALGVTPKSSPGLFKVGGLQDIDNLPAQQWDRRLPGIIDATGTDRSETYLNRNGLINLIADEASGQSAWLYTRQQAEQLDEAIGGMEDAVAALEDKIDAHRETLGLPKPKERVRATASKGTEGSSGKGSEAVGDSQNADGSEGGSAGTTEGGAGSKGVPVTSYENLPRRPSDKLSRFLRAFKINPEKSRLMGFAAPARHVLEILRDFATRKDELKLPYFVDEGQAQGWSRMLKEEGKRLTDLMNARLREKSAELKGMTPLEALNQATTGEGTTDWLGIREAMGLNMVDASTGEYDPRLLQSAMMAAIHWFMTTPKTQNLDDAEVASLFNDMDVSMVTETMRDAVNSGIGIGQAKSGLAKMIVKFWGAEVNRAAPMSDVTGMSEHMAIELMQAMFGEKGHFGELKSFTTQNTEGENKNHSTIFMTNKATAALVKELKGSKGLLGDSFVPDAARMFYFDHVPANDRETQKGNFLSRLGQRTMKALQVQREIGRYRNTMFLNLMNAMGEESWFALKGGKPVEINHMNGIHRISVEGLNNSVRYSWEGVMEYAAQLEAYVKQHNEGKEPDQHIKADDVRVHYDYNVASNERQMADGFNGQSDKGMREAAVATRSKLDLSKERDRQAFWLTVGQSSGLVKTEKGTRAANAAKAEAEIAKKFPESLAILRAWVTDPTDALSTEDRATIVNEATQGGKGSQKSIDKIMHSLMAVARYENAMTNQDQASPEITEFTHDLSLEADGKTDGPMNLILHFTSGIFDALNLSHMRRGGFFPGQMGMTLNKHGATDSVDMYQYGTNLFNQKFIKRKEMLSGSAESADMVEAVERLLGNLGDVTIDPITGDLQITRNGIKNNFTIKGYGSGDKGIAGKVTSLMLDVLYEHLTALEQEKIGNPQAKLGLVMPGVDVEQMKDDLELLTNRRLWFKKSKTKGVESTWETDTQTSRGQFAPPLMDLENGNKFKLSPEQFQMLQENIKHVFIQPMVASITEVFGNAQRTVETYQHATQIMSIVMMDRFRTAVQEQLAAKRASGAVEKGDFLSTQDYEDIFKKLAKYGAFVEPVASDENSLNLSIKEGGKTEQQFSRGFGGEMGDRSTMMAPRKAGVSVSPLITISRGDARMMVNFYAAEGAREAGVTRTEPVYDGLEMPADLIEVLSERINKAVSDAWLENPAQDVSDSFADWLRQGAKGPLDGIGVAAGAEVNLILNRFNESHNKVRNSSIATDYGITMLKDALSNTARSITARKNVFKRIGYSVDHMASGEAPYDHEGLMWDGKGTYEGWLNTLYQEELAKLPDIAANARRNPKPATEPKSGALWKRIDQYGERILNDGSDAVMTRLSAKAMIAVLDSDLVPAMHKPVIKALAKIMPDFTFMIGGAAALTEWRQNAFQLEGQPDIQLGLTDYASGIIYITNPASETIVHELLHAALGKILTDHYSGSKTSIDEKTAEIQKAAIGNLEKLMRQFMNMDFSGEDDGVRTAAKTLRSVIQDYAGEELDAFDPSAAPDGEEDILGTIRKFGALSEFISWSLANQNLKDVLSVSKVKKDTGLSRIKDFSLKLLRRLLGMAPEVSLDVFSNILLNTGVLMHTIRNDADQKMKDSLSAGLSLSQVDPKAVAHARMTLIREKFEAKVGAHLRAKALKTPGYANAERYKVDTLAYVAVNRFMKAGFQFDLEQASTFRTIQAAMATTMEIAPGAMAQTQKIFQHLIENLTVDKMMKDPTDDIERTDVTNKFDEIVGKNGTERDPQNRSNLLASVMALAMVDEDFRNVLDKIPLPADRKISYASADDFLNSLGESMMNTLGTAISEEGRGLAGLGSNNRNTKQALDKLVQVLARIETDDRTALEVGTQKYLDLAEGFGVAQIQKLGSKLEDIGKITQSGNKMRDTLGKSANLAAALIKKDRGAALNATAIGFANLSKSNFFPKVIKDVMSEMIGMDDTNKGVYRLMNVVKAAVAAVRQAYREELPKIFARQFKRKLAKTEWHAMHVTMAKTDMAALGELTGSELRGMIGDAAKLDAFTAEKRDVIQAEAKFLGAVGVRTLLRKAEELAQFMVTGEVKANLLKNGYAIARLNGESGQRAVERQGGPSEALVQALEAYVSLRAMDLTKAAKATEWAALEKLAATEGEGIDFLLATMVDLRNKEMDRLTSDVSKENAWKGYIPEEVAEGAILIVADDRQHNHLLSLGYTREGDYEGSGYENGKRSYYLSTVGGSSAYVQGIMQTIQVTAMGTDPATGANTSGLTAGAVRGPQVAMIERMIANKGGHPNLKGEPLIPIYSDGEVVAYERSMKPEMRALLKRNTHLGEMMGAWAGRQEEERVAESHNEILIDELKKNWDAGKKAGRAAEYTDVSDAKALDKVFGNSWDMIPRATKQYIKDTFANDPGFMIRNDMIDNSIGYRMPSVKDSWTGLSRMAPGLQKAIRDSATIVLGNKAVPWLVTAEKAWQAGIATAKHIIVVKSVIVPLSNEVSNTTQLMSRGVPIRQIIKGKTGKLVEITQYLKNRDRSIEIDAQMARHRGDTLITSKLLAQKKNLDDSNRSMSIWPLINAGEFSTISDGQTEVDAALQTGKWVEYAQDLVEKIPSKLGTVGRYAMVTRDTALFQGMARAVAYSDFLAKAVLYDHLTKTKKIPEAEAMEKISKEFVNYNFVAGRTRSYAESVGLTWFWAYKLRSVGVALNTLRENPLRALLTTFGAQFSPDIPGVSVGSVTTDNAVSVIAGNREWYSLGLGMLWTAPGLNPWLNALHSL